MRFCQSFMTELFRHLGPDVDIPAGDIGQNQSRLSWSEDELHRLLKEVMRGIHERCVEHGSSASSQYVDYVRGANVAAFEKVAGAMLAYGVV